METQRLAVERSFVIKFGVLIARRVAFLENSLRLMHYGLNNLSFLSLAIGSSARWDYTRAYQSNWRDTVHDTSKSVLPRWIGPECKPQHALLISFSHFFFYTRVQQISFLFSFIFRVFCWMHQCIKNSSMHSSSEHRISKKCFFFRRVSPNLSWRWCRCAHNLGLMGEKKITIELQYGLRLVFRMLG